MMQVIDIDGERECQLISHLTAAGPARPSGWRVGVAQPSGRPQFPSPSSSSPYGPFNRIALPSLGHEALVVIYTLRRRTERISVESERESARERELGQRLWLWLWQATFGKTGARECVRGGGERLMERNLAVAHLQSNLWHKSQAIGARVE